MLEFIIDSSSTEIKVVREPGQILQILVPEIVLWEEIRSFVNQFINDDELAMAQNLWCNDDFERKFTHQDSCLKISKPK